MASPTIFSFSLLDRLGLVAEVPLFTAYDGATETVNALQGAWAEAGGLIDAASTSQITGGHILIPSVPDGGWKDAPAAGNKNNEVAVLNFNNVFTRYVTEVLIPGYLESFIVNGKVNLAATALANIIALMADTGGDVFFQSQGGAQLTTCKDGFLTTRKRRNQRLKTRAIG